jgi:carboxypeptidase C (cathepsin A)
MFRSVRFPFIALALGCLLYSSNATAQDKPADKPAEAPTPPPKEESSVTEHTIHIGGQSISYKAIAGTLLLKNAKDEPTALVYSTSYVRTDVGDKVRPIAFIYNGGPGSSSIWLHMGSFGPRRIVTVNGEPTPPAPYKLTDNANSLLDKADLVFIDPVGTGFSHAVGKSQDKDFAGVDPDMRSLGQFIALYVTRYNRWNSPKFLIGESYGTYRSAVLGNYLQSTEGIDLNGIVLISSVLDIATIMGSTGDDRMYIVYVPTYAATAWYHKVLSDRPADLSHFLDEARQFATNEYTLALMKGANLTAPEKAAVAKKLARFTGLSEDYILKANLRVDPGQFMAELQRSRGLVTGRLDARFSGFTTDLLSETATRDPQSDAVTGAFTASFHTYLTNELKFSPDRPYHVFADFSGLGASWPFTHNGRETPNVLDDLTNAIVSNPHLQVEVENGYYDMATPFFGSEYTMAHLGLPEKLQKNIHHQFYDAGHMMYLQESDLTKLRTNVGNFIDSASHQ